MKNMSAQDVRDDILKAISDITVPVADLEARIEEASSSEPDIFQNHDDVIEAVSGRNLDWNSRYFRAHLEVAKRGHFSEKRVRHLVEVREYLSSKNHKGFSVPSSAQGKSIAVGNLASETGKTTGSASGINVPVASMPTNKSMDMSHSGNEKADIPPHIAEAIREPRLARTALEHLFYDSTVSDSDLEKIFSWAKSNVAGLLDKYEENVFSKGMNTDKASWDIDYFWSQLVYLEGNFCSERFLHLIEVRAYLRDVVKAPELQRVVRGSGTNTASDHEETRGTTTRGRRREEKKDFLDHVFEFAEWGIGKVFSLIDYLKSKVR